MVNQLLGNHAIDSLTTVDWGVSYNTVKGDMPDRIQNTFENEGDGYRIAQNAPAENHRYFQKLTEDELAANLSVGRKFGALVDGKAKGNVTAGYSGRFKKRDFQAIQFNFDTNQELRDTPVDPDNVDAIYNATNYNSGLFEIEAFSRLQPQTYDGEQNIHAGYVNADYKLADKFTTSLGLRYERIEQTVNWITQFEPRGGTDTFNRNEFLPNLIMKYELNEKHNLRFAASKTYTLPQFKERSPFIYEDVTEIKYGNPDLYPSRDYNIDFKWEFFPERDELISATVFGKYIQDPIAEINIASTSNDITWVNVSDQGTVYGVEVEVKKNILSFESEFSNKLSAGLNVAYMKTKQDLDNDKIMNETEFSTIFTNKTSSFTGASDLLLNADVSYTKDWSVDKGITATIMYSYYSDRLYAVGTQQKGNIIDRGMGALDFVFKTRLGRHLGVDLIGRNLLNPEFERVQENATGHVKALTFKRGAYIGLGLTYKL